MSHHNFKSIDTYEIANHGICKIYTCGMCNLVIHSMNIPVIVGGFIIGNFGGKIVYEDISTICEEIMIEKLLQA